MKSPAVGNIVFAQFDGEYNIPETVPCDLSKYHLIQDEIKLK